MIYQEYYDMLLQHQLISPIWLEVTKLIDDELGDKPNKQEILSLFLIYFALIDDGNLGMSLHSEQLKDKWNLKLNGTRIRLLEKEHFDTTLLDKLQQESVSLINQYLSSISSDNLPEIIGPRKLFIISDDYLYTRKNETSRKSICDSVSRLFSSYQASKEQIDLECYCNPKVKLAEAQIEIINKGQLNNLLVTGGPGTGKTTSIIFLLVSLLLQNTDYNIYITAPSGKAASRMKDSIINGIGFGINDDFKNSHTNIIEILQSLEGQTIHRLLGYNGEYKYNKDNQFPQNAIFIIDEASMIDAFIFSKLLEAIPTGARVFILGDKNQLPSVECGAVFGDLLALPQLKNNVVTLTESQRFKKGSDIDILANIVNNNEDLPNINWQDSSSFLIEEDNKIHYYSDICDDEGQMISNILSQWQVQYLDGLQSKCLDIEYDLDTFNHIYDEVEISKILCAENESIRGVKKINRYLLQHLYTKDDFSINGLYCGEIIMINQNDYQLDVFNGDTGIVVKFKNDSMYYVMFKKSSKFALEKQKKENKIFKCGDYIFYPAHMFSKEEFNTAYAITIHKSQGSDYKNILVILPKMKGHPLLNRQIVYTAITRTKGTTYILSNEERLNEAKETVLKRDTNL